MFLRAQQNDLHIPNTQQMLAALNYNDWPSSPFISCPDMGPSVVP